MTYVSSSWISSGLQIKGPEKTLREKEVSEHGLGVVTAAIFLAGEMAGSGVLALPFAMKGTSTWTWKKSFSNSIFYTITYIHT